KGREHATAVGAEFVFVLTPDSNVFARIRCKVSVRVPEAHMNVANVQRPSRLVVGDVLNLRNCVTDGCPAGALSHCVLDQLTTVQGDSKIDDKQDEEKEQWDDEGKLDEGLAFLVTEQAGPQATFSQECQEDSAHCQSLLP